MLSDVLVSESTCFISCLFNVNVKVFKVSMQCGKSHIHFLPQIISRALFRRIKSWNFPKWLFAHRSSFLRFALPDRAHPAKLTPPSHTTPNLNLILIRHLNQQLLELESDKSALWAQLSDFLSNLPSKQSNKPKLFFSLYIRILCNVKTLARVVRAHLKSRLFLSLSPNGSPPISLSAEEMESKKKAIIYLFWFPLEGRGNKKGEEEKSGWKWVACSVGAIILRPRAFWH